MLARCWALWAISVGQEASALGLEEDGPDDISGLTMIPEEPEEELFFLGKVVMITGGERGGERVGGLGRRIDWLNTY